MNILLSGIHSLEKWDLETGNHIDITSKIKQYPKMYIGATGVGGEYLSENKATFTETRVTLEPYGSCLLCLSERKKATGEETNVTVNVPLKQKWEISIENRKYISESLCLEDVGEFYYSGTFEIRGTVNISPTFHYKKAYIIAEEVADILEVEVNGNGCGVRIFDPYKLDITEYLEKGENSISLKVTNTLLNSLRQAPKRSGIYGDILLEFILE